MISFLKILVTLLLAIFSIASVYAQLKTSKYEVGINVGTLVYQGDLSRSFIGEYKTLKPAIGISVARSFDPYFSLRGNLTFGKISSDELKYSSPRWKQFRAFNFSTPVTELSASLVFNPFGDDSERRLTPYLTAGIGLTLLNVKRDWSKYDSTFYPAKSQVQIGLGVDTLYTPPRAIAVLPVGVGLRYVLSSQWALNVEGNYRFTASDYVDGFKHSGNPSNSDNYYGISLGLTYRFGGYKCPSVR